MAPERRSKRKADALEEPTADANNVATETVAEDVATEVAKKATTTRKGRTTKADTTVLAKKKTDTNKVTKSKTTKTITPPASQSQRDTRSRAQEKEKTVSPKDKTAEQAEPPAKRSRPTPKSSQEKPAAKAAPKAKAPKTKAVAKPIKPVKPVAKEKAVVKPVAKPVVAKAAPKAKPAPKPLPILTKPPTERLKVFQCGTGEYCELGLGPKPNAKIVKRPRLNEFLDIEKVGVVAIAYGGMHGAVLTHDGKVYTWGVNDLGALGRITKAKDEKLKDADAESDSEDEEEVPLNEDESTPKLVEFPEGTVITRIACCDSATIAVTETGLVYGWGTFRSNDGVLGFSVNSRIQQTPVLVQGLKNIIDVACGNDHVLALDNKGKAWAWGNGQQNQLGRRVIERTRIQGLIPREVGISRKKVKSIHSGSFHSFAVTTDGLVYSWGLNSFAQCGMYMETQDESITLLVPVPTRVTALEDQDVVMLDGGDRHSIALTSKGDLLAWGRMDAHQVGIGLDKVPIENVILDVSGKPRCLIVPSKITDIKFKTIASGSNHNIAIGEDGAAYSWGFGDQYQCGHGEPGQDVKEPTKIVNTATSSVNMVAAACGGQITVLAGIPKSNGE